MNQDDNRFTLTLDRHAEEALYHDAVLLLINSWEEYWIAPLAQLVQSNPHLEPAMTLIHGHLTRFREVLPTLAGESLVKGGAIIAEALQVFMLELARVAADHKLNVVFERALLKIDQLTPPAAAEATAHAGSRPTVH